MKRPSIHLSNVSRRSRRPAARPRLSHAYRPRIEQLEQRELLTAGAFLQGTAFIDPRVIGTRPPLLRPTCRGDALTLEPFSLRLAGPEGRAQNLFVFLDMRRDQKEGFI